jgi:hypothetical protein
MNQYDETLKKFFKKNDEELQKNIQLPKGIIDVSGTSEAVWNVFKELRKEDK